MSARKARQRALFKQWHAFRTRPAWARPFFVRHLFKQTSVTLGAFWKAFQAADAKGVKP